MQVIVDPVDLETEIREIPKIIDELKAVICGRGSVCEIGAVDQPMQRAVQQKDDNEDKTLSLN